MPSRVASNVEAFAWLLLAAGVAGGAWIGFEKQSVCDQFGCENRHPYVGLGIGLAIASAFQTVVVVMVAVYIKARMSDE